MKKYTVLVNFGKPWHVRCRSDLDSPKFKKHRLKDKAYRVRGVWYLPVYTGSKEKATHIANKLRETAGEM